MHAQRAARVGVLGEPLDQELLEGLELRLGAAQLARDGGELVLYGLRFSGLRLGSELPVQQLHPSNLGTLLVPERIEHVFCMLLQQRGIGAAGHVLVAREEFAHQGALRLAEEPEKVAHLHARRRTAGRTRPVGAPAAG